MRIVQVVAERVMKAAPDRVQAVLVDYSGRRKEILPEGFSEYAVEQGGQGAGTIMRYRFQRARRDRVYRMEVTQAAGGEIVERDLTSSLVTTWKVRPEASGSRVEIETHWNGAPGIGGFFERTFAPKVLSRMYDDMLARLQTVAES